MSCRTMMVGPARALAGCAAETPPPQAGAELGLFGTWTGVWDNDPRFTTSLAIDRVTPSGMVQGRCVFQFQRTSPFSTRLEGRSFRFGTD